MISKSEGTFFGLIKDLNDLGREYYLKFLETDYKGT